MPETHANNAAEGSHAVHGAHVEILFLSFVRAAYIQDVVDID